ncbi:MAG: hypothetical protein ABI488_23750 [Polyangiaceae bacterium]
MALKIERTLVVGDAGQIFRTVIDAARLDRHDGICGESVVFTALKERVVAAPGVIWKLTQRTRLTEDGQSLSTLTINDNGGKPLFVSMVGASPTLFDAELLKDLTLAVPSAPVCNWGTGEDALGTASLRGTGDGACDIDSNATRCCRLWGGEYQVRVHSVAFNRNAPSRSTVNLSILAPGMLKSI